MSATHADAGAFPFLARTSKLFFQKRELEGWRIDMATGSGDWFVNRHRTLTPDRHPILIEKQVSAELRAGQAICTPGGAWKRETQKIP